MGILQAAISAGRWDLAAHALVLALARQLKEGDQALDRQKPQPEPETARRPR